MTLHAAEPLEREAELLRLEELIAEVSRSPAPDPQSERLMDSLQSARAYLFGAMPGEYQLSLQMAGKAALAMKEPLRSKLRSALHELVVRSSQLR